MGHRPVKNDDPSMKGQRSRNKGDGRMRQKRGDTRAQTLEREYGVDLKVPPNTRLDTMRKKTGETDLADILRKLKK